jgi:hypothetical protein
VQEPANEQPTADTSAERGRRQAVAVAVTVIGAMVLPATLGATPLGALMMQLVLFGLLFVQLFRGRAWARWIVVALTGLVAVAHAAAAAGFGPEQPRGLSIAFAILFGWSALVLALSRHVARFVRDQRAKHP